MPVTVLGADGLGQDSDIIEGVVWAVQHGADVINMSFSNPGYSGALQAAIDYAWDHDVVVVAATGNDGSSSGMFPAGDRGVIGVSATDRSDTLAPSSNYGPDVFLAAPGVDILTTTPGGGSTSISGTSASSAIVAAAAGLLRAADPSASNGVIVGRLARNADPAGSVAETGNGRVNLARALSDTSSDGVKPHGAAPVGDGGPIVGPYVAAAVQLQGVAAPAPANEGNGSSHTITFTIQMGGSGAAIPIWWRTQGGTATGGAACGAGVDYVTIPSTTASQGDTDRSVSVTICEDTVVEANETVTLQAADNAAFNNGGGDKMASATATILNDDVAANQPPTATNLSAPETYVEDTTLNLVNIVASDVDSATVTATLTLSNTAAGSLTTGTSGAVTSTYVAGTGVWTASGAIADVNTLLAGVSFVPALNFNSNLTIATSVSDGALSVSGPKTVTGTPVNDAPSFIKGANQTVLEDAGAQSASGWATAISAGPANESGQAVDFIVSNNNNALFAVQPAVSPTGTLTYTPAGNANGSATVSVQIHDNGGVLNGGVDTSAVQTFTITVTPVNDAPTATNLSARRDVRRGHDAQPRRTSSRATSTAPPSRPRSPCPTRPRAASPPAPRARSPRPTSRAPACGPRRARSPTSTPSWPASASSRPSTSTRTSRSRPACPTAPCRSAASKTVTGTPVNDAPVVVLSGDFSTANEGETRTYLYTVTDVDSASPEITESCSGDALRISDVADNSFACKFLEGPGSATVTVTADDGSSSDNIGSDNHSVLIENVAPTAVLGNDGPVGEGSTVTASFTGQADPSGVDTTAGFHYAFDCANASLASATYAGSGTSASTTCTYPDGPATKTVRARIIDEDGGYTEYTTTVTVNNVAPSVTPPDVDAPENQGATEGSARSFAIGSFVDAGVSDGPWAVKVDWGDSTAVSTFNQATQGSLGTVAHTYADDGLYTVTVYVTDKDTATGHATFSVTVNNVAPTIAISGAASVNEGSAYSLTLGAVTDPGTDTVSELHRPLGRRQLRQLHRPTASRPTPTPTAPTPGRSRST